VLQLGPANVTRCVAQLSAPDEMSALIQPCHLHHDSKEVRRPTRQIASREFCFCLALWFMPCASITAAAWVSGIMCAAPGTIVSKTAEPSAPPFFT